MGMDWKKLHLSCRISCTPRRQGKRAAHGLVIVLMNSVTHFRFTRMPAMVRQCMPMAPIAMPMSANCQNRRQYWNAQGAQGAQGALTWARNHRRVHNNVNTFNFHACIETPWAPWAPWAFIDLCLFWMPMVNPHTLGILGIHFIIKKKMKRVMRFVKTKIGYWAA